MTMFSLRHTAFVVATAVVSIFVFEACFGQHDPRPNWRRFEKERIESNKPVAVLTATGEIPTDDANKGPGIEEKYTTFCAGCHGASGGGDGPAGVALTPKPRNFHEKDWQAKVDDAHIAKTIKEGGPAVGLSPMMGPWGGVLSDEEVAQMVQLIRDFGKT